MNKTILITGASHGIGRECTIFFARKGFNVIANYNKSKDDIINLQHILAEEGFNIEIFKADVSKKDEVADMVSFCVEKFNNIDILINNAAISNITPFLDITSENWENMINVNLNSLFYVTKDVLKNMINRKSGCIINISSIWGIVGSSCEVHYSTAKAGIIGFTKALAKEMGPSNIRINCVAPGYIQTEMNKDFSFEELEYIKKETPLQKLGKPIDIIKCINWLIEDEFTTGQIISPNGGWVIY